MAGAAASLFVKLGLTDKDFSDGLKQAENKMRRFGDRLATLGSRITNGISLPFLAAGAAAIKLGADMESTSVAFTTLLGSAVKAQVQLEKLKDFAAQTPFQFTELTDATRRMLAMGFTAEQTIPILRVLGDTVSALGVGQEGLNNIILALGQMQMKGKVSAEEMTRQLGQYINAWQYLANFLKTDTATAMDMAKKGMIDGATGVRAILEGLANDPRFAGGMKKQMDTIWGLWSNFIDNLKFALADLGNEIAKSTNLKEILKDLTEGIKDFTDWFAKLDPPTKNLIVKFALFLGVLGPLLIVIGKINTGFSALIGILRMIPTSGIITFFTNYATAISEAAKGSHAATSAIAIMNGTILQTAAAIGGLIAVIWSLKVAMDSFKDMKVALMKPEDIKNITDINKAYQTQASLRKEIARIEGEIQNMETGGGLYAVKRKFFKESNEEDLKLYKEQLKDLKENEKAVEEVIAKLTDIKLPEIEVPKIPGLSSTDPFGGETEADIIKRRTEQGTKNMIEYIQMLNEETAAMYGQNTKAAEEWAEKVRGIVADAAQGMEQSLSNGFFDIIKGDFDNLGDYFQNFLDSILRSWTNTMAQMMTQKIMGNGGFNFFSNLFGGGMASGGSVSAGTTYLVGERGPELFTPSSSGTITPNHALGGVTIKEINVVNNTGIAATPKTNIKADPDGYIINVVLNAVNQNKGGFKDALAASVAR